MSPEGDVKKKVLIVDDEAPFVDTLRVRLEYEGYEVISADNGEDGLQKAKENPLLDIIITDVMMPKMNGYQLCRELKKNEGTKNIPVIMATAKAQDSDKLWGKETGADAYITKPFEFDDLLNKVKEFLKE